MPTVLSVSCPVCRCELDHCCECVQTSNFLSATVLSCRKSNSRRRSGRDTDKTVSSCLARRCGFALRLRRLVHFLKKNALPACVLGCIWRESLNEKNGFQKVDRIHRNVRLGSTEMWRRVGRSQNFVLGPFRATQRRIYKQSLGRAVNRSKMRDANRALRLLFYFQTKTRVRIKQISASALSSRRKSRTRRTWWDGIISCI